MTLPSQISAAAQACSDATVLVNNAGAMLTAPMLADNGGGAIVNMLSVVSWIVNPFNATYCAFKHAALAVTNALRIELKAQGTLVLGVYAGFIGGESERAQKLASAGCGPHAGRTAQWRRSCSGRSKRTRHPSCAADRSCRC